MQTLRDTAAAAAARLKDVVGRIRADTDLMSRIYIITLAMSLLVLAIAVKGPEQKGRVISDAEGNALKIERNSTDTAEQYELELLVQEAGEIITREIKLSLKALTNGSNEEDIAGITEAPDRRAVLDTEIDGIISDIEDSGKETILLPDHLDDGTAITWRQLDKKDYTIIALIPCIYIALLIYVIRYSGERKSDRDEIRRRSIIRGLPRFCNQLFLMMNAGMILSDAFEYITSGYASGMGDSEITSKEEDYFEREMAEIHSKDPERRKSTASLIKEFALENDVKEMIRIATILTENEKRGSDVIESLSRESRYLWDERRIVARESGKMIDTGMSYPLGILLILLIVITMAPAMLSM